MLELSVSENSGGWIYRVDTRAKMLVCIIASLISIAVSSFWGQLVLLAAAFIYALSLKRPLILAIAYLGVALMTLMALGFFWIMVWFIPKLGQNFHMSSLLVPFMRILVMIHAALPLIVSSRIQDMLRALQSLRLPLCIYLPTAVIFRFVPSFMHDIRQVSESLQLRGYRLTPWAITRHPLFSARLLFTPLLFRSLRSSEDLGIAAELKGLGYSKRMTSFYPASWSWRETILTGAACMTACCALACQLYFGGKGFMA